MRSSDDGCALGALFGFDDGFALGALLGCDDGCALGALLAPMMAVLNKEAGSDDECIAEYFMGFLELLAAASEHR